MTFGARAPSIFRPISKMALASLILGISMTNSILQPPEPPREFRGAWVATVDNIDWPSKKGLPVEQLQQELSSIVDRAAQLKLNAIIFQVRPMADALYPSKFEPWAEWITGTQGKAPMEGKKTFDPLAYMIAACHSRGIELHAWFNPYRAWHPKATSKPDGKHVLSAHKDWVKTYGNYKWLDPGQTDVADWSLKVIQDVVDRYDVDGVHIDDYFYPYPLKGQDFPDEASYARYRKRGGKLDRADWRRYNVNEFVHNFYDMVKRRKKWVKVGISPFGIYRPGMPPGIQAGTDQYAELYADAKLWLENGWCDYLAPQLYWKISQTHQAYEPLLKWWILQNVKGRHIWPGNFTSRLIKEEGDWSAQEILDQINLTRTTPGAGGNVHFSFVTFAKDLKGINEMLESGPYKEPALVPESGWLSDKKPPTPTLSVLDAGRLSKTALVRFGPRQGSAANSLAVWSRYGDQWVFSKATGPDRNIVLDASEQGRPLEEVAVASVNRAGVRSDWSFWVPDQR